MKQSRSSKLNLQVQKILWVTFSWFIVCNFFFFFEWASLNFLGCSPKFNHADRYIANVVATIIAGLAGGAFILFTMEKWLRSLPYSRALLYIFVCFSLIFFVIAGIAGTVLSSRHLHQSLFSAEVQSEVWDFLTGIGSLRKYVEWLLITLVTIIVLMVNDKYGPGVFKEFLLGRYFHAKREERIFMFLDLRASTTIAEKLGEEKYFNFIKDCFKDATPGILYSKGEIYQYVGDEIIVSWKMENGRKNANCLTCFFEIQQALQRKSAYYLEKYGVKPEFKAGLHYGFVMAGEVGIVKRDIAFSGDVLNTASRIQAKCNELNVNILISQFLLDKLALPARLFQPRKIGEMLLRGKNQSIVLYTL